MDCPRCNAPTAEETLREFGGVCPKCLLDFTAEKDAPAFPNLEILETLGEGGMGVVYKANQKHLGRTVALKVLSPQLAADPQFLERFTREARALAQLSHPNIVSIYDSGVHDRVPYLIMEYVEGSSLRKVLAARKLTPERALEVVPQICDALHYAHARGVIHRDVKPENILIDREGRVKIADFGLAKVAGRDETRITHSNMVMGTPNYMAPEQIENPARVDHRADIYSLGVIFYEMLTGELPLGRFKAPSEKALVDTRLDPVVLKSLEKEPADRYQGASELKADVSRVREREAPAPPLASPSTHRSALLRATVLMGALVLLILGITYTSGSSSTSTGTTEWTKIGAFSPWLEVQTVTELGRRGDRTWNVNIATFSFLALAWFVFAVGWLIRSRPVRPAGGPRVSPFAWAAVALLGVVVLGILVLLMMPMSAGGSSGMGWVLFGVLALLGLISAVLAVIGLIHIGTSRGRYVGIARCIVVLAVGGLFLISALFLALFASGGSSNIPAPVAVSETRAPVSAFRIADAWPRKEDLPPGLSLVQDLEGERAARVAALTEEVEKAAVTIRSMVLSPGRFVVTGLEFRDAEARVRWERHVPMPGMKWAASGGRSMLWMSHDDPSTAKDFQRQAALREVLRRRLNDACTKRGD